jgi:hypothetical protein
MARIRSIKPEFFSDEKIMELSPTARLAFIGLWCYADDSGNQDASVKQTHARIFPGDSVNVESCVAELLTHGLLMEYSVNGSRYWNIPNFRKHQKINRPSPPRVPGPDRANSPPDSRSAHGGLTTGSGSGSGSGSGGDKDLARDESSVQKSLDHPAGEKFETAKSNPTRDRCPAPGCQRKGSIKINGRWFCYAHNPEKIDASPNLDAGMNEILSDAEKFLRGE